VLFRSPQNPKTPEIRLKYKIFNLKFIYSQYFSPS
jgi:hypothetical protein